MGEIGTVDEASILVYLLIIVLFVIFVGLYIRRARLLMVRIVGFSVIVFAILFGLTAALRIGTGHAEGIVPAVWQIAGEVWTLRTTGIVLFAISAVAGTLMAKWADD